MWNRVLAATSEFSFFDEVGVEGPEEATALPYYATSARAWVEGRTTQV